eukprot:TRINITY_DN3034_c0_g4_i3.p1 TRINITY_DN3034_c0_g4~~TRINITY_DN3034_c0_g4_i3.p1  ORF type:complete len:223 (-),score=70.16 TRINITY_DN3034_c0_g4_i3:82-726(-)
MIRRPPRSTHCISSAASDVYKRQLQSKRRDIEEDTSSRRRFSKSKVTPKEELAVRGFMRLWTELQEKDKRSLPQEEEMERDSVVSRQHREKSASQQWEQASESEEAKNLRQTEPNPSMQPPISSPIEPPSEASSLITKDYVLSMMQDVSTKVVEKPLFKKCLAHAGIAYYIQFSREGAEKANGLKNGGVKGIGFAENEQQRGLLEILKSMQKNA